MAAGANPFVGEICIVGFNFAPVGWATCDGQLMAISQNTALFSLLGTNYGGDGMSTFALPNFMGSSPMGTGTGPGLTGRVTGETGGSQTVNLQQTELPLHTHPFVPVIKTGTTPNTANAVNSLPATSQTADLLYSTTATASFMTPLAVNLDPQTGVFGANGAHNNMQPFLTMNFIIATQGIFPARS